MNVRRRRLPGVLLVCGGLLAATACGSRIDHKALLDANTVKVSAGSAGAAGSSGVDASGTSSGAAGTGSGSSTGSAATAATPGGSSSGGATSNGASGGGPGGGSASAVGTPGETGPIIIGSVGNYSGPAGAAAVGMPQGMKVWVNAVNAKGGLFGRTVQLVVVDDQGDPAQHLSAVRDLVENRHAVAFVGNYAPLTAGAATSYLAGKGVPVIGEDCGIPLYSQHPDVYFSECGPSDGVEANVIAAAPKLGLGKKVGIVFCGEAQICKDGDAAAARIAAANHVQIVYRAQISLVEPDFTSECLSAKSAGADSMFIITDPNGVARVGESCARQGFRPQMLGSANVSADAPSRSGLENMLVAQPTFPFTGSPLPGAKEFYAAWDRYANGDRAPSTSSGWASAKLFELAATRAAASSKSISAKTLVAALRTIKGEDLGGLTAPLDFSTGRFNIPNCYWTMQGANGTWKVLNGGKPICS